MNYILRHKSAGILFADVNEETPRHCLMSEHFALAYHAELPLGVKEFVSVEYVAEPEIQERSWKPFAHYMC